MRWECRILTNEKNYLLATWDTHFMLMVIPMGTRHVGQFWARVTQVLQMR